MQLTPRGVGVDGKGKLQDWELPKVGSVQGYSAKGQLPLCR